MARIEAIPAAAMSARRCWRFDVPGNDEDVRAAPEEPGQRHRLRRLPEPRATSAMPSAVSASIIASSMRWTMSESVDPPARLVLGTAGPGAMPRHAVSGRGIVDTFRNRLDPHVQTGALVPILRGWWPRYEGPRLSVSRRFMPTPLRAVVDLATGTARTDGSAGSAT